MKRIFIFAMTAAVSFAAKAQDVILRVAPGTSEVTVTVPAGEYVVNDEARTSTGEPMTIALNGATTVSFAMSDGSSMTAFAATGQKAITGCDAKKGAGIVKMDLHGNGLTEFDMTTSTNVPAIKELYLNDNELSTVSLTGKRWNGLEILDVSENRLTSLSTSYLTALRILDCSNNNISSISTSGMTELTTLWCDNNNIKSLALTGNTMLESVVADNNELTTLNAKGTNKLVDAWFSGNRLTQADLSGSSNILTLNAANNNLTSLTMTAPEGKLLFADMSGNRLMYDGLYDPTSVLNYNYGNQQEFAFDPSTSENSEGSTDKYAQGETITFPEMGATTLNGTNITLSTKWYNWETNDELKQGSKSGSTGDYVRVTNNKQYYFKTGFSGRTYATQTYSKMPNLVLKSKVITIYNPDGINELKAAGFTFSIIPGGVQMSSQQAKKISMTDMSGRVVWSGTVDSRGVQVDGLSSGTYVVNGLKIAI